MNDGRLVEAEEEFLEAIRLEPRNSWGYYNLGVVYDRMGRYDDAERYYAKAIDIDPRNSLAHDNLSQLRRWLSERKAREAISRAFNQAWKLAEERRYSEAVMAYQEVLRLDPKNKAAWNNLANALDRLRRHEEAEAAYHRALAIDPNYTLARENLARMRSDIANAEGNRHWDAKDYAAAARSYEEALRINPANQAAAENLKNVRAAKANAEGNRYWDAKDYAAAARSYEEALRIDPSNRAAAANLRSVLAAKANAEGDEHYSAGNYDAAIAKYKEALAHHPGSDVARERLRRAYAAKAHRGVEKTIVENIPAETSRLVEQGTAAFRQGLMDQAIEHFRQALEKNPGHKAYSDWLRSAQQWRERQGVLKRMEKEAVEASARLERRFAQVHSRAWPSKVETMNEPSEREKPAFDLVEKTQDWIQNLVKTRIVERIAERSRLFSAYSSAKGVREELKDLRDSFLGENASTLRLALSPDNVSALASPTGDGGHAERYYEKVLERGQAYRDMSWEKFEERIKGGIQELLFSATETRWTVEKPGAVPLNDPGPHPDQARWDYHKYYLKWFQEP
jgi:tetratricopeptide (TPR) repeat protein